MSYSYPISVVVGTAGADIVATDGFELVIPANAFRGDVTVTIAAPVTATTVSGLTNVSRAWAIGPVDQAFAVSATVFVPYFSSYESRRSSIKDYMCDTVGNPDPGGWVPAPQDMSKSGKMGGTISKIQCVMACIPT